MPSKVLTGKIKQMRTSYKILIVVFLLGPVYLLVPVQEALAGPCVTQLTASASPSPAPYNQNVAISGSVTFNGTTFEDPGSTNGGACLWSGRAVRSIQVSFTDGRGLLSPVIINLTPGSVGPYSFTRSFIPSSRGWRAGETMVITVNVGSTAGGAFLAPAQTVRVNLTAGVFQTYACVSATDGKYACSPQKLRDCSDVPASANCRPNSCVQIPDSQCGQPASGQTHKSCVNNTCTNVAGSGTDECTTLGAQCSSGGGGGEGAPTSFNFSLRPPTGIETFQDLVNVIGRWIFNLAIPIAVIMIIWAGVLMLTSGGKPEQFRKGMTALKYAVIGLAIVLIGKGFVSLIKSILDLRN